MLNLYIRTRGLKVDYSFLPEKATIQDFNDYRSDIEKPTCILEYTSKNNPNNPNGYLFISGIPSKRKDHQGTPIRYDLVATFNSPNYVDVGDSSDELKNYLTGLTNLIWMWLNDVKEALQQIEAEGKISHQLVRLPSAKSSKLGKLLDNKLSEEYLEELLQLTNDGKLSTEKSTELSDKLRDLLLNDEFKNIERPELTNSSGESGEQQDESWWGGINNDDSCNKWIKLVEEILKNGIEGKALLLNIATPQSLTRLCVKDRKLGVLLAKEYSRSQPELIDTRDLSKDTTNVVKNILKNIKEDDSIPVNLQNMAESTLKVFFSKQD